MAIVLNGEELSGSALFILFLSTLTTLSSGTNYVVGSYAPQYADKLHLSSTQISLVAAAGNWGVYMTGPLFGWIVDKFGPRVPIAAGGVSLGLGYLGLYYGYQHTDPYALPIPVLASFSFLTGLGSSAGMIAGLNAVALTFTQQTRGTAMGIVIAGYGLSAFLYATISAYISGDNTSAFLLILAIGTFGSFSITATFLTPHHLAIARAPVPMSPTARPMGRSLSTLSGHSEDEVEEPESPSKLEHKIVKTTDVGGLGLFKQVDYWLLMLVAFCLTGTGLMWINTVGTVVVTLARFNSNPGQISRLQAHQTSLLSVFNCIGRLFSGAVSDGARAKLGVRPIWWLLFQSFTFLFSQWLAKGATDLTSLSWATSFVGFSYGQFFGLAPVIMLDWFGMGSFSSNVGWLYVVPTFSSYTFSHLFGAVYDSNVDTSSTFDRRAELDRHTHICGLGRQCYVQVFSYTLLACSVAIVVSFALSIRRGRTREVKQPEVLDEEYRIEQ